MKILQISYDLSPGGAERLALDLSNELARMHEVHLLAVLDDKVEERSFYKHELSENIKYSCASEKSGFRLRKIINLYKIVKQISPDIVHFHGVLLIYYFILPVLFFRKPKYLETIHSKADVLFTFRRLSFVSRLIYKLNLVSLCTISGENKKSLERVCNIYNSTLIYNGGRNPVASDKIDQVKKEVDFLKTTNNDIVFIHIGRCTNGKNQKMLINAFNKITEQNFSFILLIVGTEFDTDYGEELKKLANPKNIFFLGTKTNIIDYLLCSDALCLSSLYEGMPITLIEALACGCVPVCTPVSGVIDLVVDGETGFISENFSEISYFNTIKRYIKNRDKILKSKLFEIYSEKLTIEKCANNYNDLYYKLSGPLEG